MTSRFVGWRFTVTAFIAIGTANLWGAELRTSRWNGLCELAEKNEVALTVATGKTIRGRCISASEGSLSLNSHGRLLTINRSDVKRIWLLRKTRRLLPVLGEQFGFMLAGGILSLGSPESAVGVVLIPTALAYGAVGTPICVVHDLAQKIFHDKVAIEITVI